MTESADAVNKDDPEYVQVGEAPIREAKRLQAALDERKVAVRLASDPESCNSCSPKILMMIHRNDVEKFQAFLKEEHVRNLGDLVHDSGAAEQVFDTEKEEATCPACSTVFSTKLAECPDCGLGFGAV